jgi:hypothetical protein
VRAYGAVFGLAVARLPIARAVLVLAGIVWGAVVFVISAFIGLPAAAVFDSGDQITDMAETRHRHRPTPAEQS